MCFLFGCCGKWGIVEMGNTENRRWPAFSFGVVIININQDYVKPVGSALGVQINTAP
jgi:hypothetical protein